MSDESKPSVPRFNKALTLGIATIIVIICVGGYFGYRLLVPKNGDATTNSATATSQGQEVNSTTANQTNQTDLAIVEQDLKSVDNDIANLDAESKSVDDALNDQPVDLN